MKWYVLKERNLIHSSLPPYLSKETLNLIGQAINEGSLNIETKTVKAWYKHLLEENVTHSGKPGSRELVPCRVERPRRNPLCGLEEVMDGREHPRCIIQNEFISMENAS